MINQASKDILCDKLGRLLDLAVSNKVHFQVITDVLAKSSLLKNIENNNFYELENNDVTSLYNHYFGYTYFEDKINNFNDAYWCGQIYVNLFYKYNKSFSYIFLKLPLAQLLDMYSVYHEMDISSIYEVFEKQEKENTILDLLLKKHSMKSTELAKMTKIKINTLKAYKLSDINLYKGSFSNIHRIAMVLDEPDNLFLETLF